MLCLHFHEILMTRNPICCKGLKLLGLILLRFIHGPFLHLLLITIEIYGRGIADIIKSWLIHLNKYYYMMCILR